MHIYLSIYLYKYLHLSIYLYIYIYIYRRNRGNGFNPNRPFRRGRGTIWFLFRRVSIVWGSLSVCVFVIC